MPRAPAWSRGVHRKGRVGSLRRRRSGRCPAGCRGHCGLLCSLSGDLRMGDRLTWRKGRRRERGRFGGGDGWRKGRRRLNATLWRWCYPFSHQGASSESAQVVVAECSGSFFRTGGKKRCLVGVRGGPSLPDDELGGGVPRGSRCDGRVDGGVVLCGWQADEQPCVLFKARVSTRQLSKGRDG